MRNPWQRYNPRDCFGAWFTQREVAAVLSSIPTSITDSQFDRHLLDKYKGGNLKFRFMTKEML